jgi:GHMP kinases N terminal domain
LRIEASAPTRIDLAGGTLDIWPLYLFHPGALTVNCAITRSASCTVEPAPGGSRRITLVSLDTQRKESFTSLDALVRAKHYRLPLLAELVRFFHPRSGFTLTTNSAAPAGAGIGGSSAMAVAICAALDRFTRAGLKRQDWIHISRDVEALLRFISSRAASGARNWIAIWPHWNGGWFFVTPANLVNPRSTTGRFSSAISMATRSSFAIYKGLRRSQWSYARHSSRVTGPESGGSCEMSGTFDAEIWQPSPPLSSTRSYPAGVGKARSQARFAEQAAEVASRCSSSRTRVRVSRR